MHKSLINTLVRIPHIGDREGKFVVGERIISTISGGEVTLKEVQEATFYAVASTVTNENLGTKVILWTLIDNLNPIVYLTDVVDVPDKEGSSDTKLLGYRYWLENALHVPYTVEINTSVPITPMLDLYDGMYPILDASGEVISNVKKCKFVLFAPEIGNNTRIQLVVVNTSDSDEDRATPIHGTMTMRYECANTSSEQIRRCERMRQYSEKVGNCERRLNVKEKDLDIYVGWAKSKIMRHFTTPSIFWSEVAWS